MQMRAAEGGRRASEEACEQLAPYEQALPAPRRRREKVDHEDPARLRGRWREEALVGIALSGEEELWKEKDARAVGGARSTLRRELTPPGQKSRDEH